MSTKSFSLDIPTSISTESLNELKDKFVEEAKTRLDGLKSIKGINKRADYDLGRIATSGLNGNTNLVAGLGNNVKSSLGNGAELFTQLFNVFNTQFVGKFFGIVQDQIKNQQILQQLQQNGLISKRDQASSDLDQLKSQFDAKLEKTFRESKQFKNLSTDVLNKYLELAKGFTQKLKDITLELVNSIQPILND